MHLSKFFFAALLFTLGSSLSAQDFQGEEKIVYDVIVKLFDGMRAGDSSMVHSVFFDECRMYSNSVNKKGENINEEGDLNKFLSAIGTPHEQIWDEKIWNTTVQIDLGVAQVWTEYGFYVGDKFSHCGIDAFQLMKENDQWKILQIIDTRKRDGCQELEKK